MAEASKAVSTVVTRFPFPPNANANINLNRTPPRRGKKRQRDMHSHTTTNATTNMQVLSSSTLDAINNSNANKSCMKQDHLCDISLSQSQHNYSYSQYDTLSHASRNDFDHECESISQATDDNDNDNENDVHIPFPYNNNANANTNFTDTFRKISCIFPSSFFLSSEQSSSLEKEEASLVSMTGTTVSTSTTTLSASASASVAASISSKSMSSNLPQHFSSMRVSFLPLDLDSPLDEQHGGKFDAILHKMTEDILCKSQMEESASTRESESESCASTCSCSEHERQALQRIENLKQYLQNNPACCLVDHPTHVQTLMSRSAIARTLSVSLEGVATKSGIPVRTPRCHVLKNITEEAVNKLICDSDLELGLKDSASGSELPPFHYPFIVKPLPAAGTKESHKMGVLLGRHGLSKIQQNVPSLLQQYSNHDGILFKVYVLGDKVWVFQRPSMPNLPQGEIGEGQGHGFVEFDSQKAYPTMDAFGIDVVGGSEELKCKSNAVADADADADHGVTVAEIRPVADAIRKAFGLELFGFDILVTRKNSRNGNTSNSCNSGNKNENRNNNDDKKEMLVVDVNYFPSYKEVTNFSQLLAQYLAQCGIEGRLRSFEKRRC